MIDEYDIPLQKAWMRGELLYKQVVELVRNLFSDSLKSNEYLEFAVITGCPSVGAGNSDILLRNTDTRTGIVLEFKYSDTREKL